MTSLLTLRQEIEKEIKEMNEAEKEYGRLRDIQRGLEGKHGEPPKKNVEAWKEIQKEMDKLLKVFRNLRLKETELELLNKIEPLVIEKKKVLGAVDKYISKIKERGCVMFNLTIQELEELKKELGVEK